MAERPPAPVAPGRPARIEGRAPAEQARGHAAPRGQAGLRPSRDQTRLLRAVLGTPPAHPGSWLDGLDLDRLDSGAFQLLPQLYRVLAQGAPTSRVVDRLKGVYRYAWSANAVALRHMRTALDVLAAAQVPALVAGPAAFGARYYGDLGARLIDRLEVLVRDADVSRAIAAFRRADGWDVPRIAVDRQMGAAGATAVSKDGRAVWLRWDVLDGGTRTPADEAVWCRAERVEIAGAQAWGLSPADDLLYALVRAAQWDPVPPCRWLCDAATIMQARPASLDWDHLVRQARRYGAVASARAALRFLKRNLDAPAPPQVVRGLKAYAIAPVEWLEFHVRRHRLTPLGRLPHLAFRYVRRPAESSSLRGLPGFAAWLQWVWGLPRKSRVPAYVLRRAWRRSLGMAR